VALEARALYPLWNKFLIISVMVPPCNTDLANLFQEIIKEFARANIKVSILSHKNPASKGTKINVKKLIAYP